MNGHGFTITDTNRGMIIGAIVHSLGQSSTWDAFGMDEFQADHAANMVAFHAERASTKTRVYGRPIVGAAVHHKNGDVGIVGDQVPQWHGGSHVVRVQGVKVSVPTMSVLMTSASTGLTRWVATHNLTVG